MDMLYGLPVSTIVSGANYSPWLGDGAFGRVMASVASFGLVDTLRSWELWGLARQTAPVPGDILEVGVYKGGSGLVLAHAVAEAAPQKIVHLCDTFEGVVFAGEYDPEFLGGEFSDTSEEEVAARVHGAGLTNVRLHKGIFPLETGARIEASALSLVHVDVDVWESAKLTFEWAWPRVSAGGVVVFDDYGWAHCRGVVKFVEEEVVGLQDARVLHNLNGHAVAVKHTTPSLAAITERAAAAEARAIASEARAAVAEARARAAEERAAFFAPSWLAPLRGTVGRFLRR